MEANNLMTTLGADTGSELGEDIQLGGCTEEKR